MQNWDDDTLGGVWRQRARWLKAAGNIAVSVAGNDFQRRGGGTPPVFLRKSAQSTEIAAVAFYVRQKSAHDYESKRF
jgi:hypothetical protein